MEIKLKESEIKEAVHAYLGRIFALAAGSTFAIDFQATRGPEGFIANIVIGAKDAAPAVEEGKAEVVNEPVPAQTTEAKPQVATGQPRTKRLVLDQKAKEEPVVVSEAAPVVEETVKEPDPVVVQETDDKPSFNEGNAEAEPEAQTGGFKGFPKEEDAAPVETEAAAEQQPVVRKSLFGGLGKPSNS